MRQKPRYYLTIAEEMFKSFSLLRDILQTETRPESIRRFDREIVRLLFLRQELVEAFGDFEIAQDITTQIYLCSINPAYRMLIYSLRATGKQRP